ncbi:MAG TPA: hypothetical protein VM677_24950 [Actinokineospora sp.]|nr:hypothetical protein [Actinokineospora sp.]
MSERTGTAKILVLIAAATLFAAGGVVCFLVILFRRHLPGWPISGAIAYTLISLLTVGIAMAITIRATTVRRAVLGGGGTLIGGTAVAVGTLLLLVT